MIKMNKSQVSVELVVLFGFMMLVLMGFIYVVASRVVEAQQAKERAQIDDLGKTLESEIKLAASVANGYRREIDIPYTVGGLSYDITFSDAATINGNHTELVLKLVNISDDYELLVFLPKNIYGSLKKGKNVILKYPNGSIMLQQ